MGATLDIQRQQRMDLLDQQLLLAQYNEARRNARPQPQAGLLQWTRLFPSLRHRGQNGPPMQPQPQAQTQQSAPPPSLNNSPVAEEQVWVLLLLLLRSAGRYKKYISRYTTIKYVFSYSLIK
ncbi:ubiquitin-associated domain-containing protein 2-like [Oryzias melastigma]|uniref:ubiquitin-associated domain-containing protein 2-like n=1 Tax=Oryzias melastigma TaxID=30732 RepID=UPI00168D1FCA|nr:ubiquitin-associated domain-containing protein 2-like [Oryzias melastigma]